MRLSSARRIEVEVLKRVAGRPDAATILGRLASRLLMRQGSEDGQWFFHHSLIEGVVYDTMLLARRSALHLKISEVLKARWAGNESEHAEVLAYHLMKAGENSEALEYLMLAGERAALRSANEAAINYFEQAAEVLSTSTYDFGQYPLASGGWVGRRLSLYGAARRLDGGIESRVWS